MFVDIAPELAEIAPTRHDDLMITCSALSQKKCQRRWSTSAIAAAKSTPNFPTMAARSLSRPFTFSQCPSRFQTIEVSPLTTSRPIYLLRRTQTCTFSISRCQSYPRDRNPNRGVSALRGTGLRQPVSMSKYPLPEPQLERTKKTPETTDADHGLWGFFGPEKKALATPEEDYAHGMFV